jgi:hypothetical protein
MSLHNADRSSSIDSSFAEASSLSPSAPSAADSSIFNTLRPFTSPNEALRGFGIGVRAPRRIKLRMDSDLTRQQRLAVRDAPSPPRTTGGASSEGGGSFKLGVERDASGVLTPQSSEVGSSKGVRRDEELAASFSRASVEPSRRLPSTTSTSRSPPAIRSAPPLHPNHSSSHSVSSPIHAAAGSLPFARHSVSQSVSDLSSSNPHSSTAGAGSYSTAGPLDDDLHTLSRSTVNLIFNRAGLRRNEVESLPGESSPRSQSSSSEADTEAGKRHPRRRMDVLGLGGQHGRERSRRVSQNKE